MCSTGALIGGFAVLFLFPLLAPARPAAEFIWLSDVHFDPTANPSIVDALAEASVDDWPHILASSPPAHFSRFGEDTNWLLLASTLDAIHKKAPQAQFLVVTGDLLVHHFHERFESTAKEHDEEAYRRFSRKTVQFVAAQLASLAPGKPVLFTLGNNDNDCGDYQVQPDGPFLRDGSGWFEKMLGFLGNRNADAEWTSLGSYNVAHPSLKHYRVIAVNSIYFSPHYHDACASGVKSNPAREEMQWLDRQLAEARNQREKVWLILHIPPGVDGYATAHANAHGGPEEIVWMWNPAYTEQFQDLLTRYRGIVTITLGGHEHMDDIRLLENSLVLLTPAVSPVYLQNPAFRIVAFRPDGTLVDEKTYYLSNLDSVATGAAPEWKLEYSYASAWGVRLLIFESVRKVYNEIAFRSAARERWMTLYAVSAGEIVTNGNFAWLFCAGGNVTKQSYEGCVEGIQKGPK